MARKRTKQSPGATRSATTDDLVLDGFPGSGSHSGIEAEPSGEDRQQQNVEEVNRTQGQNRESGRQPCGELTMEPLPD